MEPPEFGDERARETADLRMPALGAVAWLGAVGGDELAGRWLAAPVMLVVVAGVVAALATRRRRGATIAALLVVAAGAAGSAAVRQAQVTDNAVTALAADQAVVTLVGTVSSDPALVPGRFGDEVIWRLETHAVTGRGQVHAVRVPILVVARASTGTAPLGSTVRLVGRLVPATSTDVSALVVAASGPTVVRSPGVWWAAAAAVRASLRASVADRPADQRVLVPALVDGDDAGLDATLKTDFRTTGLTHLLAVSGTNLTLVVGFVLVVARWCRVRGRWLYLVGALGTAGFVLIARTEPSVLRAAVMGSVGLVAMGWDGRQRGARALGTAVLILVVLDPGLAVSPGFALSALATAGILLLAPGWRDAMSRWLPRWLAEAVAVPAAAQVACTPLIAAISGQVSLIAVGANLLVAPVVGPATVLGLAGGLLGLVWGPLGRVPGTLAAWCVAWVVTVARHGAALPTAAVGWGSGPLALAGLTALMVGLVLLLPRLLRQRTTGLACCAVLVVAVLVRLPTPGWPPSGWVMVACDVGQGDGLVLNAGPGAAVVVDAGPDPATMDGCLDRLGVRRVPLVLLTHFHADHVDGIDGVLAGRTVQAVETTRLQDPPAGVDVVDRAAASVGLRPTMALYGTTTAYGAVTLQRLWPLPGSPTTGPGDGSTANEASVVLLVTVGGVRLLLTGDVDPEGQAVLAKLLPGLHVDVLKMPHHGSRYQDEPWLLSLQPRLVLVSVGANNDYGQPSAATLRPLTDAGATVLRTDQSGDIAVVAGHGDVHAVSRG